MQNGQNKDAHVEAPPKLVTALRQLPQEHVFVPPTLDEAILKAARTHLGGAEKPKRRWLRLIPWTVAAAGFATAVLVAYPYATQFLGFEPSTVSVRRGMENRTEPGARPPQNHGLEYAREDINRDGKVDILDAFLLAKKLRAAPTDFNLDMNRDRLLDQHDVETIAAHAVSLEKRGRS